MAAPARSSDALDGLPLAVEFAAARLNVENIDGLAGDRPSLVEPLESGAV